MSIRSYFVTVPTKDDANTRRINVDPVDVYEANTKRVRTEKRLKRMMTDCKFFKKKFLVVKARCIREAAQFAFEGENVVLRG